MESILKTILATKQQEIQLAKQQTPLADLVNELADAPEPRNFLQAIRENNDVSLIAEVKKASPSKGLIRENFRPTEIAKSYADAGATCISVLTDEKYFQGKLDYLTDIRSIVDVPILRKDFIVNEYQVFQARVAGADAVLLIAECLDNEKLQDLHDSIIDLDMTPLVELHDPKNLESVLDCGAKLVGINNRNLETFETDLNHCLSLRKLIPDDVTLVCESGIFINDHVNQLREANIDAMLVGESLMRSDDIHAAVKALLN